MRFAAATMLSPLLWLTNTYKTAGALEAELAQEIERLRTVQEAGGELLMDEDDWGEEDEDDDDDEEEEEEEGLEVRCRSCFPSPSDPGRLK
jgi:hypothetical protein